MDRCIFMFSLIAQSGQNATEPNWMLWVAFVLGIFNTALIAGPALNWLLKDAKLDFRLTLEVFFRLIEEGESLFANAAIVPEGAAVKLTDVTLTLTKTDSPTKSYPVKVIAFGTKTPSSQPSAQHLFYTKSPYHYLPENQVLRPLWHCVLGSYCKQIKEQFTAFDEFLLEFARKESEAQKAGQTISGVDEQVHVEISKRVVAIMEHVQLEAGTFSLSAEVSYQARAGWLRRRITRQAKSSIIFKVEEKIKDDMKASLASTLLNIAYNTLRNKSFSVNYPEYAPVDVQEE